MGVTVLLEFAIQVALAAFVVQPSAPLGGEVIYVDAHAAGPVHDGSSWCQAFVYLQDALADAKASAGVVTEIRVAKGLYTPGQGGSQTSGDRFATFQLINGVTIKGGYTGCERVAYPHRRDGAPDESILSGDLNGDDTPGACSEYSDCCVEHQALGCDDPGCEAIVCELVPFCCEAGAIPGATWDDLCVSRARHYCCDAFYNSCENSLHVVTATGTDGSAVLEGFAICGGYAKGDSRHNYQVEPTGGGLFSEGGSATIRNCTFRDNSAASGGGLYASDGANLTVQGCTFTRNSVGSTAQGSAVSIKYSDPILEDCTFVENHGIAVGSLGDPTLVRCAFISNEGTGFSSRGDATLTDCTFIDNSNVFGAGMANYRGHAVLTNCAFIGNTGMAMYNGWANALTLINCTFLGNHGTPLFNGGIALVVNCLFSGNDASRAPSAVYTAEGFIRMTNCTVVSNSGGTGAVHTEYARAIITNSIIWGNTKNGLGGESAQISGGDSEITIRHSSVEGWTGTYGGTGNSAHDPLFVDPLGPDGIAGTEDDNLRLSPDSPAIGTGDPAYVPSLEGTDLDGNPRLTGCRVDLGAYEAAMEQLPGDFDANAWVDLADLAGFQLCMGVSIVRPDWLDTCLCLFDADESGDIDLYDFAAFHALLRGVR